jgi:uncharacterized protein involved in exopolysaccharide biosynthesis
MENNNNQNVMLEEEESAFDLKQIWTLLVLNWHWILISMIACVLIALAYLWFTPSTLTVTGKMQIIDKSKSSSGMSAGLAMLNSLPMGLGSSLGGAAGAGSIESEKEIILSNTLVTRVVKDLNLHTEYRLSRWGKQTQLYQNNPIEVTLDEAHLAWMDSELPLYFHQIKLTISKDSKGYTVEPTLVEGQDETDLPAQTFATLPATVKTESGTLTLTENKLPEKMAKAYEGNYTLKVVITPPTIAANALIGKTTLEPPSKKVTNITNVTLTTENLLLGIDYVNHLVEAYNQRANDEKNEEARKTDEFVNERLAKVDAELGSSDAAWENTKKNFQITDPSVDAGDAMAKKSLYEQQLVSIGTELQLHDYLSEYVNNPANLYEIIPVGISANAGSEESGASGTASLLAQHNTLVNQRKDLLKSVSEMSPQFQRVTQSIQELQPVIQTSLKRDRQAIIMRQNTLQREYGRYMGRVGSAPQMERVLTEIGRQREIKQGVYLVMLQKREETAMELANIVDKGKLIDPPAADPRSNKPQKKIVLLVALFLGALLPMGILYLLQMFKQRIDTREELEASTKLPILAELTAANADESIRNLRTNLLLNLKEGEKTILVASQNDGDGKSYIAQQLEESLVAIGKKVALINGDLRKNPSSINHHPSDILAGSDFAQQIAQAKSSNDYLIFDSPALAQYADAYQLAQFADATLFVVKSGKTDKPTIETLSSDNKLPNPMFVLNK